MSKFLVILAAASAACAAELHQITESELAQTRPAIPAPNRFGTAKIGVGAFDANWRKFGAYLQRIIDQVQIEWERRILPEADKPGAGTSVAVKFTLNSEGRVVKISVEQSTANAAANRACVSALTSRMPYGSWTDAMRAALGDHQEMTFTFHYQ